MAKLHQIKHVDIENTYWGYSTSLWFNGCPHRCLGCWNANTWDIDETLNIPNQDVVDEVLFALDEYLPKDLSLLGGDPLAPFNLEDLEEILTGVLSKRPQTRILCWTGYRWEFLVKSPLYKKILPMIDILIDGRYIKKLHVEGRKYGSSNQRIINVKESLQEGKIVLAPEIYEE